ncbi:12656_t:CDS:1, partial [Ambispora gerdemannii]
MSKFEVLQDLTDDIDFDELSSSEIVSLEEESNNGSSEGSDEELSKNKSGLIKKTKIKKEIINDDSDAEQSYERKPRRPEDNSWRTQKASVRLPIKLPN